MWRAVRWYAARTTPSATYSRKRPSGIVLDALPINLLSALRAIGSSLRGTLYEQTS